jgi:hypothetical protein
MLRPILDSASSVVAGAHVRRPGGDCAEQTARVASTRLHPKYHDATSQNDIAILKLETRLTFDKVCA